MNEYEMRDKLAKVLSHSVSGRRIHTVLAEDHSEIIGTSRVYWDNTVVAVLNTLFPYVRTVEDLDDLPEGETILSEQGGLWTAQKQSDGTNLWREAGSALLHYSEEIALPARVMYFPEVVDTNLEY